MEKIFSIDPELYESSLLLQAKEDFSDVATIEISEWKILISSDTEAEIDEIFNEFMNYYIGLFNQ